MSLDDYFLVAVTGHRPDKLEGKEKMVRGFLREQLISLNVIPGGALKPPAVITGMAQGVDTWMAETCLELGIPFLAAVPFEAQADNWPRDERARRRGLLIKSKWHHVVTPGLPTYRPGLFHKRNEWMVDKCAYLIAVWNGDNRGGTAACVRYARRQKPKRPELDGWQLEPRTGEERSLFEVQP